MDKIFAKKLETGDEIRIISPSSSMQRVGGFDENLIAKIRLENQGFKVSFGAHILENDQFASSTIASRVADLHDAFLDTNVKMIMTTIGGFNSNELLPYIDWNIIRNNPKIFIGYSDITSLHNAIRAQTGLVTYYGPCYSSFKMDELQDFQTEAWLKAVTQSTYDLKPSSVWTSDLWFDASLPRKPMANQWKVYHHGQASGTATGGNIQTYYLQAGTKFLPHVEKPILFLEEAEGGGGLEFSRELAQILQLHGDIKALVIGRFPLVNKMSETELHAILNKFPILKRIPVIYDVDFGHTQPILTFPLGGKIAVNTQDAGEVKITILQG